MSIEIKNAITKLVETIEKKPQVATFVFRASSYSEKDNFAVCSQIRGFKTTIDEPLELGGTDSGPNPVELLLAALGGCQEIVYRYRLITYIYLRNNLQTAIIYLKVEKAKIHR